MVACDRCALSRELERWSDALGHAQQQCEKVTEQVAKGGSDCQSFLRKCNGDLLTCQVDSQECRSDVAMIEAGDAGRVGR